MRHNVLHSLPLVDSAGWFSKLQEQARQPYPEALQQAIIARNLPLLRRALSSELHQIEQAVVRDDAASVHHRVAALLASDLDILLARCGSHPMLLGTPALAAEKTLQTSCYGCPMMRRNPTCTGCA